jgi:hypothetical protein
MILNKEVGEMANAREKFKAERMKEDQQNISQ